MAKVFIKGKIPKRIGNYLLYPLQGEVIIREKSGFTSEGVKYDPKYELTRKNASEFGRVSSLCKMMRLALNGILPKKNGRVVTNCLAKQMKFILSLDRDSVRGERQLWKAFLNEEAKELMTGYAFNPHGILPQVLNEGLSLAASGNLVLSGVRVADVISFPDGSDSMGIRLHHLYFDFTDGMSQLCSSDWLFLKDDSRIKNFLLPCSFPEKSIGIRFSILEIRFYASAHGGFVSSAGGTNIVHVLRVV